MYYYYFSLHRLPQGLMGQGSRAWGGDKIMINVFKDGFSCCSGNGLKGARQKLEALRGLRQ